MLERDYSGNANDAAPVGSDAKLLLCSLPSQVQTLLKTICSIAMMKATMTEIGLSRTCFSLLHLFAHRTRIGFDSVKCPLGKLSRSVIMQGMGVLRQIEAKISCQVGAASLAELSSQFYTFIPHVTGMTAPPTIRDLEVVASKVELLMCLLDVTVAVRKMEASEQAVVHPLDHVYSSLDCSIQPLQPGPLLDTLRNYMVTPAIRPGASSSCLSFTLRQTTTHGETHQEWKLELQAAYIISRSEEEVRFEPHKHDRNRRLLWFDFPPPTPTLSRYFIGVSLALLLLARHGSRTSNVIP